MDLKSKKSAIMFNAFVMPGTGHLLLGQKVKGYSITVLIIAAIIVPMMRYMLTVVRLFNEVIAGHSATPLTGVLLNAWLVNRRFILACIFLILILWIYSVVDLLIFKKKLPIDHRS